MRVTPLMQAEMRTVLIGRSWSIKGATAEKLNAINAYALRAGESDVGLLAAQLLNQYETEFTEYYRLDLGTLSWLPQDLVALVSGRTETVESLMGSAFGPKSGDLRLEQMTFRRCFLVALQSLPDPGGFREAIVAALRVREWRYCFVIPAGGLTRRRGFRFHRLEMDAAPVCRIAVLRERLSALIRTDRAPGAEETGSQDLRTRQNWDTSEEVRFLSALLVAKRDRTRATTATHKSMLYGWCFTRRPSVVRAKRWALLRNPARVSRLLRDALRWTPAQFPIDELLRYLAEHGVVLAQAQLDSLREVVEFEAGAWGPFEETDVLAFIAEELVTNDEAIRP